MIESTTRTHLKTLRIPMALFTFIFSLMANAWEAYPDQYVIQLKAPIHNYAQTDLATKLDAKFIRNIRDDVILIQRNHAEKHSAAMTQIKAQPFVKTVEPNYKYHALKAPNDPLYKDQWGLHNIGSPDKEGVLGLAGVDINMEKAWDISTGSKNVVVAVIDTGVDFTIPDLKDNAWTNQVEFHGLPQVDDDKNGYVDDIHGFNFSTIQDPAPGGGTLSTDPADPTDDHGHGSHCSGVIGARGDDGQGMAGVNWNVSIMAVKFLDANGGGSLAGAVAAIDFATKNGAQIMSNSWGGGPASTILDDAIKRAGVAGALFVAAAGNDGTDNDASPSYPASYSDDNILAVAAVNNRGSLADFSNFGAKSVHVGAPGVNVISVTPGGPQNWSGTSMATPHVSGVAAILKANEPGLNYKQIKERIIKTARPVAGLKGKVSSGGMVDAFYALTNGTPPADPYDPSSWVQSLAQSISSPHPYPDSYTNTWTIKVPGAKYIAVHFAKFATESGFDTVSLLNSQSALIAKISGAHTGEFSPIVDGDTVTVKFESDNTNNMYGFDIDKVVYE